MLNYDCDFCRDIAYFCGFPSLGWSGILLQIIRIYQIPQSLEIDAGFWTTMNDHIHYRWEHVWQRFQDASWVQNSQKQCEILKMSAPAAHSTGQTETLLGM